MGELPGTDSNPDRPRPVANRPGSEGDRPPPERGWPSDGEEVTCPARRSRRGAALRPRGTSGRCVLAGRARRRNWPAGSHDQPLPCRGFETAPSSRDSRPSHVSRLPANAWSDPCRQFRLPPTTGWSQRSSRHHKRRSVASRLTHSCSGTTFQSIRASLASSSSGRRTPARRPLRS